MPTITNRLDAIEAAIGDARSRDREERGREFFRLIDDNEIVVEDFERLMFEDLERFREDIARGRDDARHRSRLVGPLTGVAPGRCRADRPRESSMRVLLLGFPHSGAGAPATTKNLLVSGPVQTALNRTKG